MWGRILNLLWNHDHGGNDRGAKLTGAAIASTAWGGTSEIADVVTSGGTELAGSSAKIADAGHVHRIGAGAIVNADVNASAAIAQTKLTGYAFLAYNSADDATVTGAGATITVDFDTEVHDLGSAFASDTFTAPATGKYALTAVVRCNALTAAMTLATLRIVTSNRTYTTQVNIGAIRTSGNEATLVLPVPSADMDANDTASVTLTISNSATGDAAGVGGSATAITYFSGAMVGSG